MVSGFLNQVPRGQTGVKMSVKVSLEQVVQQLTDALVDAGKVDAGNKSAGTRVRKAAQDAVVALKEVRKQVLDVRQAD
jgi:hypothetical protein